MVSKELKEYAESHTKEASYLYNNLLWNSKLISGDEYGDNITHISSKFGIMSIEAENEAILKSW